jgi:hypothetical protein
VGNPCRPCCSSSSPRSRRAARTRRGRRGHPGQGGASPLALLRPATLAHSRGGAQRRAWHRPGRVGLVAPDLMFWWAAVAQLLVFRLARHGASAVRKLTCRPTWIRRAAVRGADGGARGRQDYELLFNAGVAGIFGPVCARPTVFTPPDSFYPDILPRPTVHPARQFLPRATVYLVRPTESASQGTRVPAAATEVLEAIRAAAPRCARGASPWRDQGSNS